MLPTPLKISQFKNYIDFNHIIRYILFIPICSVEIVEETKITEVFDLYLFTVCSMKISLQSSEQSIEKDINLLETVCKQIRNS